MEYEHTGTAENAETIVRKMVEEALAVRDLPPDEIRVAVKEHVVQRIGCAIAVVVFWPGEMGFARCPKLGRLGATAWRGTTVSPGPGGPQAVKASAILTMIRTGFKQV